MSSEDEMNKQVEPDYNGADIDQLLLEKKELIQELKQLLGDERPPQVDSFPYYDDLFYLRYILSFNNPKDAVPPVLKTVAWRNDPEAKEYLDQCADDAKLWKQNKLVQTFTSYSVGGVHNCKADGGPLVIIRPGLAPQARLFDVLTYEQIKKVHFAFRESSFRQCDRITRESRKFVKQMLIFDMTDVNFSDLMDRRGQKVHEPVSRACASYYPQLQAQFVIINAPSWISVMFAMMKKIMPARNVAKVALCPVSGGTAKGDVSKCPFAREHLLKNKVPKFLGGEFPDESLAPELTGALIVSTEDADKFLTDITVNRRSTSCVTVEVKEGMIVDWIVKVEAYGIKMQAELVGGDTKQRTMIHESSVEEKLKAEAGVATGSWTMPASGSLEVMFDNTYSVWRSKRIKYRISGAMPPTEEEMDDMSKDLAKASTKKAEEGQQQGEE